MLCKESSDCKGGTAGFCNFDDNKSGHCEYCQDILAFPKGCLETGFINKRGEKECQRICEGR